MALYHLSVKIIARAQGRSAVAAAAYRSASRLYEQHTGLWHDFTRKQAVVARGIVAPEGSPSWMQNRSALWNSVEAAERRKDAQLARDVCLALPKELSLGEQEALLKDYVQEQFVRHGMVADYAIHHDNPNNPHAHVLLTMRRVEEKGFGLKEPAWNARTRLLTWRQAWADCSNRALALAGHDVRIDARSYAEQGLGIVPGIKIGVAPSRQGQDGRDVVRERLEAQAEVRRVNGAAILQDPTLVTTALTRQQSTFTARDVRRWLDGHTVDGAQADAALKKVLALPTLVELSRNPRGELRWTTQEMLDCERRLVEDARTLAMTKGRAAGAALSSPSLPSSSSTLNSVLGDATFSAEQTTALQHVVKDVQLAVLEGYAGSGKSRLLRAARVQWEAQGLRVRGAALAGLAAEGLEASSGIASTTLAAWERKQETTDALGPRDVLVVDEAGMVGTRQLGRVLGHARKAGAKVVLVGDTAQLQAIEAGAPMRAVGQAVGAARLQGVRRQALDWQRQASMDFAEGKVEAALGAYDAYGYVHGHADQEGALAAVLEGWAAGRRVASGATHAMLAYRRDEVAQLNQAAHAQRQRIGELGRGREVVTESGLRYFAENERLVFLRNDAGLGVRNGTTGTLERIDEQMLQVRLDGAARRRIVVDLQRYRHLDYGYASTVHRAQGMTVDRVNVLASPSFDRHISYVACTRHVDKLEVHWSREAFGDERQFARRMGQARSRVTALEAEQKAQSISMKPSLQGPTATAQLRQVRALLAKAPPSFGQALARLPAVQGQQKAVDEATRRLAHYAESLSLHRLSHPITGRLPWGGPYTHDLQTGEVMRLRVCHQQARRTLHKATAQLASLKTDPLVQQQAREALHEEEKVRAQMQRDFPALQQRAVREQALVEEGILLRAKEIGRARAMGKQKKREKGREKEGREL